MTEVKGDGFTLNLSEKTGNIEVKKISETVCGNTTILTITPADEFFERAFGRKPNSKEKIQFQVVCSNDYAKLITKAIGLTSAKEPEIVPSSRS